MKRRNQIKWALIAACLALTFSVSAQVPLQFNYQGRLTGTNGVPVSGTTNMAVFKIIRGGTATDRLKAGLQTEAVSRCAH